MQIVSTADVGARERVPLWRETISSTYVPLEFAVDRPDNFVGRIQSESLGAIAVSRVEARRHRASRTDRLCAAHDAPFYKLSMPLTGSATVTQAGRRSLLGPGDLTLYDTSQPYEILDESGRMLVLLIPHEVIRLPRNALANLTARTIRGNEGIGALFAPMLRSLGDNIDSLHLLQSQRLGDHVLDMVTTLYTDVLARDGYSPEDPASLIRARIDAFIDANLRDPALNPDGIAEGCYISTGYLHRLFRTEGTTVSARIRTLRLARCRRDLLDPGHWEQPVSSIGASWGFIDAAHFSRVFKAEYGMSPRDFRASAAIAPVGTAAS